MMSNDYRQKDDRRSIVVLGLMAALLPFTLSVFLPAVPSIAAATGATDRLAQSAISILFIGQLLGLIWLGPLADRVGMVRIAVVGLVLLMFGGLICISAQQIWQILAGRFVQGLGVAATSMMSRAVARQMFAAKELGPALSKISLFSSVAAAVAPTIGGVVVEYGNWRLVFLVMVVLSLVAMPLFLRFVSDPAPGKLVTSPAVGITSFKVIATDLPATCLAISGAVVMAGWFVYTIASPNMFILDFGIEPSKYGLTAILTGASFGLGNAISSRLHRTYGNLVSCSVGVALVAGAALALSTVSFGGASGWQSLLLLICVYNCGNGIVSPSFSTRVLNRTEHGIGVWSAVLGIMVVIASAVSTSLFSAGGFRGAGDMAKFLAVIAALAVTLFLLGEALRRSIGSTSFNTSSED